MPWLVLASVHTEKVLEGFVVRIDGKLSSREVVIGEICNTDMIGQTFFQVELISFLLELEI